ncbi:MAG: TerB family tellurite resistance protein [Pseudomonadales bacterium]
MLKSLLDRLLSPTPRADTKDPVALAAAALLMEVGWADQTATTAEIAHMRETLIERFGLDESSVSALIDDAAAAHAQSVGLQRYTRLITEHWDEPARFDLVVRLWEVALADDALDRYEEHTIRRIAELLYVEHNRFIEAKRRARDNRGLVG